jgi:antitoxin component YwqK of YwqJK toxin-antitoxin module
MNNKNDANYWIKVYFSNGKVLHKKQMTLNEVYGVYARYNQKKFMHFSVLKIENGKI